jgi:hypothetical protein
MAKKPQKAPKEASLPAPAPEPSERERAAMMTASKKHEARPLPVGVKVESYEDNKCMIGPSHNDHRGWLIRLGDAFGTTSEDFARSQLNLVAGIANMGATPEGQEAAINSMLAAISSVQPRDEVEGMLAVQMAATHNLAMDLLGKTKRAQYLQQQESNGNLAIKLLRTYTAQIEALAKLRRGGEQTVRVEHVHVHPGAQAIVGNVSNHAGGGGTQRNCDQPHAPINPKAPAFAPGSPLWSEDESRDAVSVPSGERESPL